MNRTGKDPECEPARQSGNGSKSSQYLFLVFLVAYCLIVSRRPDALFNAQFFAEDGRIWYLQAYDLGWLRSLMVPYSGFLETLPRIVAGLALLVPLRFAPLVMNVAGIAFQALPVSILLSRRSASLGRPAERLLYAGAYLALPNTAWLDATITNVQWHLAAAACLLILAHPPQSRGWRVFDLAIISLCGLTGPFCFILLAVGFVFWWYRRDSRQVSVLLVLAFGALLQALTLYLRTPGRGTGFLNATVESFVRILAGEVYLGSLLGRNNLASNGHLALLGSVALLGTIVLTYFFRFGCFELKLYVAFSMSMFAAVLVSPGSVPRNPGRWDSLKVSADAQYWFFPMLGFAWAVIWCFRHSPSQWMQILSTTMLFFMCIGILKDWRYPPYSDLKFQEYVLRLQTAPPGAVISIPLNPVVNGRTWTMQIKKRALR